MIVRQSPGLHIVPKEFRHLPVSKLFSMGYDTTDIALSTKRDESDVYNLLAAHREAKRQSVQKLSLIMGSSSRPWSSRPPVSSSRPAVATKS